MVYISGYLLGEETAVQCLAMGENGILRLELPI